jgi:pimeloyl-ACP methyl ester carboxylesterase
MRQILRHALVLLACGLSACGTVAPPPPRTAPASPSPGSADKVIDQGHFLFQLGGKPVGGETFTIRQRAGGYQIESATSMNMGANKLRGSLTTDGEFRPLSGHFTGQIGDDEVSLTLSTNPEGHLEQVLELGGQEQRDTADSKVDLFVATGTMAQLAPLCFIAGGARALHVFPDAPAKIGPRKPLAVADRHLETRVVTVGPTTVTLVCDGVELVAAAQPLGGFSAAREGQEALLAIVAPAPREKPATPDDLVELERSVRLPASLGLGQDARLGCSLMVPRAYGALTKRPKAASQTPPLPAVVFITGSGAQDRDEDTVGPGGLKLAIFKTMAVALAHGGIASLRCDDPGIGESTGDFSQGTRERFTAMVLAEVALLRAEPIIDGGRIALVGHSEGGYLAPLAALTDHRIRALVLMAAPGRALDTLIVEQTAAAARRAGATPAEVQAAVDRASAVFDAWKSGQPVPDDVPAAELSFWRAAEPWLKSYLGYDPLVTARKLAKVGVLIAQGGKDIQVREVDARALEGAFKAGGNGDVTVKLYPELNHVFAVSTTGDVADYADPHAEVDAGFLADVVAFLRRALRV